VNDGPIRRDLTVRSDDVALAGSLWVPERAPAATVLMHPGSGPSDRDNDVYFPPIREHLLAHGIAVCSFDKRGVGGSTGKWEQAAIGEQADDALAAVDALLALDDLDSPVGLFGHSQGGWVVVDAASRSADVAFVVTNSGPGVTPGEQERYAAHAHLMREGAAATAIDDALERFDALVDMMRRRVPFEDVRASLAASHLSADNLDLPDEEAHWELMSAIFDYDPRPALERIQAPVLALFGADDTIVPVDESVAVYREAVPGDLLTVAVFPDGDHRVQVGDPPRLADGYPEALTSFVTAAVARARV
jgi:uncharacterized protein